jgi:hypothetical protein
MKPVVAYSRTLSALEKSVTREISPPLSLLLLDSFVVDLWMCANQVISVNIIS